MDLSQVGTLSARCKTALDIYGRVDILVNNAGVSHRGSVLDTEVDVAQRIMNVNYFGTLAITRGTDEIILVYPWYQGCMSKV